MFLHSVAKIAHIPFARSSAPDNSSQLDRACAKIATSYLYKTMPSFRIRVNICAANFDLEQVVPIGASPGFHVQRQLHRTWRRGKRT